MSNSLLTGFSGLASHQKMIEVTGHNLANLNTTGFKSSRVSFSDTFYETLNAGTGGVAGVSGGSNPSQIGSGSKLATIARNLSQGNLDATGGQFDFALEGDGFFVVNTPAGPAYTRDGAFSIDKNGFLVNAASGNYVQRFGSIGEGTAVEAGFQTAGSNSIQIPIGAKIPGTPTSGASLRGNLPVNNSVSVQHQLRTSPLTVGGNPALETDLLNNLDIINTPYSTNDAIEVMGTNAAGNTVSASIPVDGSTTVADFMTLLNTHFPDTNISLEAGQVQIESKKFGVSSLALTIQDAVGNSGGANYAAAPFQTTAQGVEGTVVRGGIEVFDESGGAHIIGVEVRKQSDGTWRLDANLAASEGTVIDGIVDGIQFNSDGSFLSSGTSGTGNSNISIQFSGATAPQLIQINFGSPNTFSGMTSIAGDSSMASEQDGYSTGTMVGYNVSGSGVIEGIVDNGRRFSVAQMAIAKFRNPQGLESQGNNLFRATNSSGVVELGAGLTGGRGGILSGQLEQSNVDIAVEFTRLIIAQRGFSANAKTITVSKELLEELTNLIR